MSHRLPLLKFTQSRLAARFIIFFIAFAVIPVLFLGGIALYFIDLSHRRDVSNLELQLIAQKNEEIEKFFADTIDILELRVGFAQKSDIELSAQQFLLHGLLEENKAFEEASFINLSGEETAKLFREEEIIADLDDVSKLPQFIEAIAGHNYIGDVYYTLSGPTITLSAPVRNRDDEIIQVLSAGANLSTLVRSISEARLGTSGYLLLLDSNGSLIANGGAKNILTGTSFMNNGRVRRLLQGKILDALGERDRYGSIIDKTPVVGAGKKLNNTGWVLMAEWPLRDADALMQDIRNQIVNMTLVSILAVLLFAPLFANRLINPIRHLETGTAEIEKGNFDYKVTIKTKDELQELGDAFNKMAKGLKRLQELKNEFVFIAAHELRTPVTAIKGYISMIFEDTTANLTDSVRQSLETVSRANDRLVQLVNDILEIARSEADRLKIEVFAVDMRDNVRVIIEEVRPLLAEKKLSLAYEPPSDLPLVLADTARLKEIIMNLVSNAIKYNRDGGSVTIFHEISGGKVITHVADTGYGLSLEDQKHVFEKFFRSEAEVFKKIQGTGLGLFITKELVEKMGGRVWMKSEKDKGSAFSFSLPIAKTIK